MVECVFKHSGYFHFQHWYYRTWNYYRSLMLCLKIMVGYHLWRSVFCIVSSLKVGNYTENTLLHRRCPTIISNVEEKYFRILSCKSAEPCCKNLFKIRKLTLEQQPFDLCSSIISLTLSRFFLAGKYLSSTMSISSFFNSIPSRQKPSQSHQNNASVILLTLRGFLPAGYFI